MGALCNHSLELTGLAGDVASPIHKLDPRAKIVGMIAITVIAVSAPVALWPVYVICAAILLVIAALARVPALEVYRRIRWVLPLILGAAILLPIFRSGGGSHDLGPFTVHDRGLEVFGAIAAKATIGTISAAILAMTTTFPTVLRGLEAMRVPRLFVLVAGFMYRYMFVIVEEVGRLRASISSRGYRPRNALHAGPLGRAATAMFLRTYARGERVHRAMLARGYEGSIPQLDPLVIGRSDVAFAGLVVITLLAVRIAAELAR